MEKVIDIFKAIGYLLLGWLTSLVLFFEPIEKILLCITFTFIGNLVIGIITGRKLKNEKVNLKKFMKALFEYGIYLFIVMCLFVIGNFMNDTSFIYTMIKTITWVVIYFYFANILKNFEKLLPTKKGVKILYYIFNLEFIKIFPFLSNYQDKDENDNTISK